MSNPPLANEATKAPRAPAKRTWLLSVPLVVAGLALLGWVARGVLSVGRQDPERLLQQARADWSSGRLDEAEAALAALAKDRPAPAAERLLRAQVAKQRGRIDLALAALEGLPDSDPEAAVIWQARGLLEFDRDRAQPAEAALLHALTLDPTLAEARRGLIDLYTIESRGSDLNAQFRRLARKGALSFDDLYLWCMGRRHDVGAAEIAAKLEAMLRNDPEDRTIRLALAENLRRLGRLAEAETALASSPAADPEARATRARLAIDRGAVNDAAGLLAGGPADHPALARLRGRLALARGDGAAAGHYRAALAADPDDRDTLFGLGQALRHAGTPEAAQPYLRAAQERDHLEWLIQNARSSTQRDDPKVLIALGDACRSLSRLHEARAWYRLALSRDPIDAQLQKRLFELDAAIKQDDGLNETLKARDSSLSPLAARLETAATARCPRGRCRVHSGQFTEARLF